MDHIGQCEGCRRYWQDLQRYDEALSAHGRQLKAGMSERCEKAIEALAEVTPPQTLSVRVVPVLGRFARLAAAAVVC